MSEQRIDTGADAASSTDADPGEGAGLASPAASGDDAEMPQPGADRPGTAAGGSGGTEGESFLRETQHRAGTDTGPPRSSGTSSAGTGSGTGSGGAGSGGTGSGGGGRPGSGPDEGRRPDPVTGEITAPPSRERREQDPGSMATEFGDRADTAPDDPDAHPSI